MGGIASTYIPVGTLLTYTAKFQAKGFLGKISGDFLSWEDLASKLKADLPNLQGAEELDVESSSGSNVTLYGYNTISLEVLNNGVDHASQFDVQSIIDGVIEGYGISVQASDITRISLPNNPDEKSAPIYTGAPSNDPPSQPSGSWLDKLLPSTGTKVLTTGVVIIVAIIALILLLPGGFARAFRTVRG